jgi:hypothetical protein
MSAHLVVIDPRGADSRRAQRDSLAGPLEAGFELVELSLGAGGVLALDSEMDATSLFVRLRVDLGDEEVTVSVAEAPAGEPVSLTFERYTPAGAALLVRRRDAVPPGLTLTFTATRAGAAVPADTLGALLAVDGLNGNMGHLVTVLSIEQQRLRRHLRAIAAARAIAGASGASLDRVGADLGVPRLEDRAVFTSGQLSSVIPEREGDASYRRRLALYRGWIFPTPSEVLTRLRTIDPSFTLEERDNPYEVAIRLLAVGDDIASAEAVRASALQRLRESQLIDPVAPDLDRAIPREAQLEEQALRARLSAGFAALPAIAAMSPALARALDRLLIFTRAVGYVDPISLVKAQDDAGGAPFELGLGAQIAVSASFSEDLTDSIAAVDPAATGAYRSIVERLQTRIAADPGLPLKLSEILEPLGFATVRRLTNSDLYLSPVPIGGVDIEGPGAAALTGGIARATFTFKDLVPATAEALESVLTAAAADAGVIGMTLDDAQIRPLLGTLPAHEAATRDRLVAARLSVTDQPALGAALAQAEPGTLVGWLITDPTAAALRAGEADDWDRVSTLTFALADAGVPALAVLMLETGDMVLVASERSLPLLGANLTQRKAVLTRWIVREATSDQAVTWTAPGTTFEFAGPRTGLLTVCVTAYRRMGRTDPMEVRPELPPGTSIGYEGYERMMNILSGACPAGVEINTWHIRQRHVSLDPDAPSAALTLSVARTFRAYRQRRYAVPSGAAISGDDDA